MTTDSHSSRKKKVYGWVNSVKDHATIWIPIVVLLIGCVWYFSRFLNPAPPTALTIASGPSEEGYHHVATELASALEADNITLKVLETNGSLQNLQMLDDPDSGVTLALVQNGLQAVRRQAKDKDNPITSLGSLYYEPVWIFHRSDLTIKRLTDLQGLRVAIGAPDSGTEALALTLLQANGLIPPEDVQSKTILPPLVRMGGSEAATALQQGSIDAAFFVTSVETSFIKDLFLNSEITFYELRRREAYARLFPYLSIVTLPEGAIDLPRNIPQKSLPILATTALLVGHESLHPATVALIIKKLTKILGGPGLLNESGEFPSSKFSSIELSVDAERYYKNGPPFLQRFVPFWVAALIDRFIFMLLPLLTILLPLLRLAGPIYQWRMRSRIYKWYKELRNIDAETAEAGLSESERVRKVHQLAEIANDLRKLDVPVSFADQLYDLQMHVEMLERRLIDPPPVDLANGPDGRQSGT